MLGFSRIWGILLSGKMVLTRYSDKHEMTLQAILKSGATLVLLVLLMPASAGQPRDPATYFFHDSFNDLREEGEIARQAGKVGVLVMFETDDCPWCRRMKETVLNQVEVQDYFRAHFQVIAINAEGDALVTGFDGEEVPETEFALKHNRVRATPVFAFFDPSGNMLTRYTGATKDSQEFLWLGEYVVEAHFRTQRFSRYKRQRKEGSS